MVDERQMERVLGYIELGVQEGARSRTAASARFAETGGFYVEPTILDGATNGMRIAQEEIFGPVVVVIPFETEAEAVGLANNTIYGLAAAVWTRDMNAAHRLSRAHSRRHRLGQCLRPLVAGDAVRRLQAVRLRSRPLATRDRQIHGLQDDLDELPLERAQGRP